MAVKKPAAKKKTASAAARRMKMDALALTLGNISALFGGSTVSLGEDGIYVTVPGFGTRIYTMVGNDFVVTYDNGTPKRPDVVSERTYIEEPIAFLLEYTSPNDNFKDVYGNIVDFAERELR